MKFRLTEEFINIPYEIARIIKKEFKGCCGPFGGKSPIVNKIGNSATITFWSQAPEETYIINPDLSVELNYSVDNVDFGVEQGAADDYDSARQEIEDHCKGDSVKDGLLDDTYFTGSLEIDDIKSFLETIEAVSNHSEDVDVDWEEE